MDGKRWQITNKLEIQYSKPMKMSRIENVLTLEHSHCSTVNKTLDFMKCHLFTEQLIYDIFRNETYGNL